MPDLLNTAASRETASSAGPRWFANETSFWRLAAVVFFLFAVIKGLRFPGEWALTQAQIDYSHGFIKRGLLGALLSLAHLHHQKPLAVVFFLELAVCFGLLALFVKAARVEGRWGSLAPTVVFCSSYAVTFLTHIVGYTDIPLAALTVALLLLRDARTRFVASLFAVPLALLIHESFLLLMLPILLFSFLVDALLAADAATRKRTLFFLAALAVLAVGIDLATSIRANLSPDEIDRFHDEIQTRVDFDLRDDFFNVLSRPLSGSVKEALDGLHYATWVVADVTSLINLLPVLLLLLHFTRKLLRVALPQDQQTQRRLWLAGLLAVVAPLALYLLGVDGARWNTGCVLAAFLVLLTLCRSLPAVPLALSMAERNAIIFVLALNMASGAGLFDGAHTHPYPFFPDLFPTQQ